MSGTVSRTVTSRASSGLARRAGRAFDLRDDRADPPPETRRSRVPVPFAQSERPGRSRIGAGDGQLGEGPRRGHHAPGAWSVKP